MSAMMIIGPLWIVGGAILITFGVIRLAMPFEDSARYRWMGWMLILSGLLLPMAAPVWAGYGLRYAVLDVIKTRGELNREEHEMEVKS